jgi:hydroxyacylglutathione hydrolase
MKIDRLVVGQLQSNCYIVYDEKKRVGIVVDPGDEPDRILEAVKEKGLEIICVVCTHGHFDHIGAVGEVKEGTGGKIVLHRDDLDLYLMAGNQAALWGFGFDPQPKPDMLVSEGDELSVGDMKFTVLSTPGHSPGGICLFGEGLLLTGDTVFAGSVGRTDLFGGNMDDLKKSFRRIISLPPETVILPGHGDFSTVGQEKESNFFVYEL